MLDRGQVAVLDNTVDQATGTIKLKATFPNASLALWPGGFINVRLLVDTERNVVSRAADRGAARAVGAPTCTCSSRTIRWTAAPCRSATRTRPRPWSPAGLRPGDRVVTDGASRLTDGAKVHVQDASAVPRPDPPPRPQPGRAPPRRAGLRPCMNISAPFIARPVATGLLAVAVLLAGLLGYGALPVSALPQVDFPTIEVSTQLPGASPEVTATLVTASLERQFGQITGLSSMQSTSSEGTSQITLQFNLSRSMDGAAQDVQAAINAAEGTLPATLPYPPVYSKVNPADAAIVTLALTSDNVPLDGVADLADTLLQPKLSQIVGVGKVTVQGGLRRAIRVRIDPARLAAYNLSMEDVRTAVSAANVNGAKGGFDGKAQAFGLSTNDQLLDPDAYRQLVISYKDSRPLAPARRGQRRGGHGEHPRRLGARRPHPPVILDIQRQPGANIVQTVADIREALPALERSLPAGVALSVVTDRTETIRASVADVQFTLLLAIGLVIAVIYLFLGSWRATVIPGIALPLSLIGTFGVMSAAGLRARQPIADGADRLDWLRGGRRDRHDRERGALHRGRACRRCRPPIAAPAQIGFTIVSLTVSLMAVFIPLLFMTGVVGRLFNEFAVTLSRLRRGLRRGVA